MSEVSMNIQEEKTRKVRPQEAADLMGVSLRAVYNRIQKYGWKTETDLESRAWIDLPEKFIKIQEGVQNEPEVHSSDFIHDVSGSVLDGFRQIYEDEIESLRSRSEKLHEENKGLHTALMKAEVECAEMRGRLEKVHEMQRAIAALEQALEQAKSANDALNNERVAITQQLVKYREAEPKPSEMPRKWWQWWGG
jgi:hypothetical protein